MQEKVQAPFKKKQSDRDKKIIKQFLKWEPLMGRTAAYQRISSTGIASYPKVVEVIKAHEASLEPVEA